MKRGLVFLGLLLVCCGGCEPQPEPLPEPKPLRLERVSQTARFRDPLMKLRQAKKIIKHGLRHESVLNVKIRLPTWRKAVARVEWAWYMRVCDAFSQWANSQNRSVANNTT